MKTRFPLFFLCAAIIFSVTGCLVEEKVTVNGEPVSEGYKIKRPIKEAIENSQ